MVFLFDRLPAFVIIYVAHIGAQIAFPLCCSVLRETYICCCHCYSESYNWCGGFYLATNECLIKHVFYGMLCGLYGVGCHGM